ncbi:MAG: DJ-1/PfpI family protein [Clostridia bacterium]|nr:DJ-1/PfpI family protein [Clostridia bacterium]
MVILFMANGTEETEAIAVFDILKRGGVEVVTVGVDEKSVCLSHGLRIECDESSRGLVLSEAPEAVILPGGMPGTLNLEKNADVIGLVKDAASRGAVVAAICAAPSILGRHGLLKGREAVCYPGFEKHLAGAVLSEKPVVRDGNIITAKGAGVALEFGAEILSALKGEEAAAAVMSAVQYSR